MSILIDADEWKNNPWYQLHGDQPSDYTGFYVAITICTVVLFSLFGLNLVICCCGPYKHYWRDPNTGNRLLLPVFIHSPRQQPPLTLQPELSALHQEV